MGNDEILTLVFFVTNDTNFQHDSSMLELQYLRYGSLVVHCIIITLTFKWCKISSAFILNCVCVCGYRNFSSHMYFNGL